MGNEKKIEIPFGAFDSELIHQEINIPNGFNAVIDGNKIILTRVESEDERIRKAIHIYLDWLDGRFEYQPKGDYTIKDMLAWLEKQGEHNKNHKTMIVKFICKKDWHGIGDYYYGKIYNGYPCEKEQKGYDIYDDNHVPTFCDEDFINEYFNIVTEEKQDEPKSDEWSEEDENKNYLLSDFFKAEYERGKADVLKSIAWSKEDEVKINRIVACLENLNVADNDILLKDVDWLKSLKTRVQPKQEWSEEDEETMSSLLSFFLVNASDRWAKYGKWLKSLKQRIENKL